MQTTIIRVGRGQAIGLAVLSLFLTFAAAQILGGPIPGLIAFCIFGIAWFAAVTSAQKWVRITALALLGATTALIIAIAGIFWAAYG